MPKGSRRKKSSKPSTLAPYVANEKSQFSFLMSEDFTCSRSNIAWRVEPAEQDAANPLLQPRYPWDSGCVFLHGSIMVDPIDQLWKVLYLSKPLGTSPSENPATGRILTYAESETACSAPGPARHRPARRVHAEQHPLRP